MAFDRYQSFRLADIVIFFIGITFLAQSVMLVSLISMRNKTLLSYGDSSPERLALEYIELHSAGGVRRFFFDYGLIAIPFPELRQRIEYKMLQEFFVNFYNLPREFKFANYMCQVLKTYIISLVEVRPVTWIVLVVLIVLNYLRIIIVDPFYQADVCQHYPAKRMDYGVHRMLAGGGGGDSEGTVSGRGPNYKYHVCNEYTLRYTFVCSMMLVVYLVGVFIASEVYIQRLIDKVLDIEEFIEQEEERMNMEEPLFDIDQLVDPEDPSPANSPKFNEAGHVAVDGEEAEEAGTPTVRGRTNTVTPRASAHYHRDSVESRTKRSKTLDFAHGMQLRRTLSLQSLELEEDGENTNGRRRSISTEVQHRPSIAQTMFDEATHFQGMVLGGKNRRHLYINCLQRLIESEEVHVTREARRMSVASNDDGHHNTHSSAGHHSTGRPSITSTLSYRPRNGGATPIVDSRGARLRHGSDGPTTVHLFTFRDVNPMNKSSSDRGSMFERAKSVLPSPRPGTKSDHHKRTDSVQRAAHYFELESETQSSKDVAAASSAPITALGKAQAFLRMVGSYCLRMLSLAVSGLLGHHIGQTADQVVQDKDILARLQEFESIFAFKNAELYYFSVELALLIQCFYIALWATNLVVIARDSYYPVMWQIALVFPLPVNFFLIKQVI